MNGGHAHRVGTDSVEKSPDLVDISGPMWTIGPSWAGCG